MRNVLESGSVLTVVRHNFYGSGKCHWKWSGAAVAKLKNDPPHVVYTCDDLGHFSVIEQVPKRSLNVHNGLHCVQNVSIVEMQLSQALPNGWIGLPAPFHGQFR